MPEEKWHVDKSKSNFKAYSFLTQTNNFPDWKITMLFYSSLHDVDGFLAAIPSVRGGPLHPRNHKFRNKMVARHLYQIAQDYSSLSQLSRWARYCKFPVTTNAEVVTSLEYYSKIHSFLEH